MQSKAIEIDGEYAYVDHGIVARVRVKSKGIRRLSYSDRADGVEVETIDFERFNGGRGRMPTVVSSRNLEPWGDVHQERLDRYRAENAAAQRVERIGDRLNVRAILGAPYVRVPFDDFVKLAERLGVSTD